MCLKLVLQNLRTAKLLMLNWNELVDIWKTSNFIPRRTQWRPSRAMNVAVYACWGQISSVTNVDTETHPSSQKDFSCSICNKVCRSARGHTRHHERKHPDGQLIRSMWNGLLAICVSFEPFKTSSIWKSSLKCSFWSYKSWRWPYSITSRRPPGMYVSKLCPKCKVQFGINR